MSYLVLKFPKQNSVFLRIEPSIKGEGRKIFQFCKRIFAKYQKVHPSSKIKLSKCIPETKRSCRATNEHFDLCKAYCFLTVHAEASINQY